MEGMRAIVALRVQVQVQGRIRAQAQVPVPVQVQAQAQVQVQVRTPIRRNSPFLRGCFFMIHVTQYCFCLRPCRDLSREASEGDRSAAGIAC